MLGSGGRAPRSPYADRARVRVRLCRRLSARRHAGHPGIALGERRSDERVPGRSVRTTRPGVPGDGAGRRGLASGQTLADSEQYEADSVAALESATESGRTCVGRSAGEVVCQPGVCQHGCRRGATHHGFEGFGREYGAGGFLNTFRMDQKCSVEWALALVVRFGCKATLLDFFRTARGGGVVEAVEQWESLLAISKEWWETGLGFSPTPPFPPPSVYRPPVWGPKRIETVPFKCW